MPLRFANQVLDSLFFTIYLYLPHHFIMNFIFNYFLIIFFICILIISLSFFFTILFSFFLLAIIYSLDLTNFILILFP